MRHQQPCPLSLQEWRRKGCQPDYPETDTGVKGVWSIYSLIPDIMDRRYYLGRSSASVKKPRGDLKRKFMLKVTFPNLLFELATTHLSTQNKLLGHQVAIKQTLNYYILIFWLNKETQLSFWLYLWDWSPILRPSLVPAFPSDLSNGLLQESVMLSAESFLKHSLLEIINVCCMRTGGDISGV